MKEAAVSGKKFVLEPLPDFYPVVTLVLYFGDTHWNRSLHLKNQLKIPDGLEGYVSDYEAHVFEISFLSDEQVKLFRSDFRFVAEYFVASRKRKEGLATEFNITVDHLRYVEEFIELMNALTSSDRFSALPKLIIDRGGDSMMTILFDEAEARGEIKGTILTYDEMGVKPSDIVGKIIQRFSLDKEDAEASVKNTLKLQRI